MRPASGEQGGDRGQQVRRRLLALLSDAYESDAAAERAIGLPPKTVSNWRAGRSCSYMRLLPQLAEHLDVGVSELLAMPVTEGTVELSREERSLIAAYRQAQELPPPLREALHRTLEDVIRLYTESAASLQSQEGQGTPQRRRKKKNDQ